MGEVAEGDHVTTSSTMRHIWDTMWVKRTFRKQPMSSSGQPSWAIIRRYTIHVRNMKTFLTDKISKSIQV